MRLILFGIILLAIVVVLRRLWRLITERKKEVGSKGQRPLAQADRCLETLGLRPDASQEEIIQAYRDLVNVWHPDRFTNNPRLQKKSEEKLKEINAAYEYLRSCFDRRHGA